MKAYVVGAIKSYLGGEVRQLINAEMEMENEPDFDKHNYDTMGNSEKVWMFYKTQEDADYSYIRLFRKLKDGCGLENFPKDWREQYDKFYQRASKDYPEII